MEASRQWRGWGFGWLSEDDFVNHFAADVDPVKAKVMHAVQQPLATSIFGDVMGVPAPDGLTVAQASKLAGDLLAVGLVIPADLPDEGGGAFADMRAPCPELIVGCGGRRGLGVEDVLRILLKQRIDGVAGANIAGFEGNPARLLLPEDSIVVDAGEYVAWSHAMNCPA